MRTSYQIELDERDRKELEERHIAELKHQSEINHLQE